MKTQDRRFPISLPSQPSLPLGAGLKISVENQAKSMLATCMLKKEQFSEFHVEQTRGEMTEIRFKANLAHVLECFAIYGKDALPLTAIHMGYDETEG